MKLQSIHLQNIRNIDEKSFQMNDGINVIAKPNRYGKTTIADSVVFALAGKLHNGNADLTSLKPIQNPKAVVAVELVFTDGERTTALKKEYAERWITPRGTTNAVLDGHDTTCYIDGLKVAKATDYDKQVCSMFNVPDTETLHALINPRLFSDKLPKEKRRAIIDRIIAKTEAVDVFKAEPFTMVLAAALETTRGDVGIIRKGASDALTASKQNADMYEAQIKGAPLPTVTEEDYLTAARTASSNMNRVTNLKAQKLGTKDALLTPLRTRQGELNEALSRSVRNDNDARTQMNAEIEDRISAARESIEKTRKLQNENIRATLKLNAEIEAAADLVSQKEGKIADLRIDYAEAIKQTYPHIDISKCPQCGFELNAAEDAERETNWAEAKRKRLADIKANGVALAKELADLRVGIVAKNKSVKSLETVNREHDEAIAKLDKSVLMLKAQLTCGAAPDSEGTTAIRDELVKVRKSISEILEAPNQTESIDEEIRAIEAQTKSAQDIITKHEAEQMNVKMKQTRETELAKTRKNIAELQQKIDLCDLYRRTYADITAKKARTAFPDIRLVLLEPNINGSFNDVCYVETETGVPYANANTEWQIKTGIGIIETLCTKLGYKSPCIIVDNAEAITADNRSFGAASSQIVLMVAQSVKEFPAGTDEEARAN